MFLTLPPVGFTSLPSEVGRRQELRFHVAPNGHRFSNNWDWHVISCHLSAMIHHLTKKHSSTWRSILEVISWLVLSVGFVSVAQIATGIIQSSRFTTDSICSAAGAFLVLLVGSLLNSVAREDNHN